MMVNYLVREVHSDFDGGLVYHIEPTTRSSLKKGLRHSGESEWLFKSKHLTAVILAVRSVHKDAIIYVNGKKVK